MPVILWKIVKETFNKKHCSPSSPITPTLHSVDSPKASWMQRTPRRCPLFGADAWVDFPSHFLKRQIPVAFKQSTRMWTWLPKKKEGDHGQKIVILPEAGSAQNHKSVGGRGWSGMCRPAKQKTTTAFTVSMPETHCWILWHEVLYTIVYIPVKNKQW